MKRTARSTAKTPNRPARRGAQPRRPKPARAGAGATPPPGTAAAPASLLLEELEAQKKLLELQNQQLRESEAKFRLMADSIGEVFWFLELEPLRVTYASPSFETIWGIPAADLYADHELWEKSIHPDDRPGVTAAFGRWMRGETTRYGMEYRVIGRDGKLRWIADRGTVLSHKDGLPHKVCGIARDVTERRLAVQALAEKEREMRAIVEGSAEGILIADVETRRLVMGNAAMCRMLGVTAEELRTMSIESIHSVSSLPELRQKFDAAARGELTLVQHAPLLRKDGSSRLVDITVAPVEIGGRLCNVGIFHDITGLKRAEEKFKSLLEAAPDAMMIHGPDARIEIVNAQAEKLLGYPREELVGQPMEMFFAERFTKGRVERRRGSARQTPARRGGGRALFARHKDGREIPVEISRSNLAADDRQLVISAVRDVSEHRKAEEALRAGEERLRLFVEHSPASVAMFDCDMRYLVASRRWAESFRLPFNDLIGRSHYEVFPDLPERWKEVYRRGLAGATESSERDQFPRADGTLDWVKWEVIPWRDNNGRIGGIILFADVINDRVRAEDALRESQRFALSTLEAIPSRIAVLDESGVILSTNEAWKQGAPPDTSAAQGRGAGGNYLDACDAASGEGDEYAMRLAGGIRDVLDGQLPRFVMDYAAPEPAEERWFLAHVTRFKGEGPRRVSVAFVDISERKRAERVVRRLNDELEKRVDERTAALNKANETLRAENAARLHLEREILEISEREQRRIGQDLHDDLGQRLAGAWCVSQALESRLRAQSSPDAACASGLSDNLGKALALTRSLARGLQPVALEGGGLMNALKDLAASAAGLFGIRCRFSCPVPVVILDNTVATNLYRIAQESVTNGAKHGRAQHIEISLDAAPDATTLSITDDGRGLPKLSPRHEGIGLRIMRYRADTIGGSLTVRRGAKGGTIVACSLPNSTLQTPNTK